MAEFATVGYGPQFHRLLLRVAGYAPDETVAQARLALAEGRVAEVAEAVAGIADTAGLGLDNEDFVLLTATAPEAAGRLSSTGAGTWPQPPGDFLPLPDDGRVFPTGALPPVLDLTDAPYGLVSALTDDADRAAIEAMDRVPGAVALWRAWRTGAPGRIYLLTADVDAAALPVVTAQVQLELIRAGLEHPRVETTAPDDELPPEQYRARAAAALLWTAGEAVPLELARVFDGVDPQTGPWFAADRPEVPEADRERFAAYLDAGHAVLMTTQRLDDVLDPARGPVVPMSYRSDGVWIWPDTVTYYLRAHGLAADPELLAHITARGFAAPRVGPVAEHRALAALFRPVEEAGAAR
ncbi:hypothetical protein [Actinoplanes sp. NPDC051494]|uniref:hypothetical protein n=1 Tax=Actinoplanes sp. NPDC051494 TaxID=3363907 RepID=UPI0037B8D3F0